MKDYCSYSPDTIFGYYIGDCCKTHDRQYNLVDWNAVHFYELRKYVDEEFRFNLKAALPTHLHFIAWIYYFGVRILGSKIFSKFKWWTETRDYGM